MQSNKLSEDTLNALYLFVHLPIEEQRRIIAVLKEHASLQGQCDDPQETDH